MKWISVEEAWVLTPPRPRAVVHFLGGAFAAAAPQLSYRALLEFLAQQHCAVVATPFLNTDFDHRRLALKAHQTFRRVSGRLFLDFFPTIGLGHSMGCKLHLLIDCYLHPPRQANIFLAYNNFSARRSIPLLRELGTLVPNLTANEFDPSPEMTNALIANRYQVQTNLLVKFQNDDIDEIPTLDSLLRFKFGADTILKVLPGNHLTCLGAEATWQPGRVFSPLDAVGQWFQQTAYQDLERLEAELAAFLRATLHRPTLAP
ncbi:MAG: DUF1350 family protein [Pseudanabaenaceae cyanobacterium]